MGDDSVLRDIGPVDVDSAGDMVSRVGVHNQAKRLINSVRENYPRELVAALSRPVDQGRSKLLIADEVERVVADSGWSDVDEVEGFRVYGKGKQAVVGIVFRTESGRSARGAIPLTEFPESNRAYDTALAEHGVVVTDEDDPRQLRRALEAAQKQLAERGGKGEVEVTVEAPEPFEGYEDADVDAVVEKLDDLTLAELVALRATEEGREDPRSGVLEPLGAILASAESVLDEEETEPFEGYEGSNVDQVVEKLPELSLAELIATKEAEEAREDPRAGVLKPLDERLSAAESALKGS